MESLRPAARVVLSACQPVDSSLLLTWLDVLLTRRPGSLAAAADIAQTIPLAFGSTSVAKVTAAGVTPEGYSICTSAGATVEMDNEMRNIAGLTWTMEAKTREHAVIIGTTGRITLSPAHAPTTLTVVTDQGIDGYPGAYHGIYV